jgi:hypothetical protein
LTYYSSRPALIPLTYPDLVRSQTFSPKFDTFHFSNIGGNVMDQVAFALALTQLALKLCPSAVEVT